MTASERSGVVAPDEIEERILEILRRHVSAPTARAVLDLALQRARLVGRVLGRSELEELGPHAVRGIGLFVSSADELAGVQSALAGIAALAGASDTETSSRQRARARLDRDATRGGATETARSGAAETRGGATETARSSAAEAARSSAGRSALAAADQRPAVVSVGRMTIRVEEDVARARAEVRRVAQALGFSSVEQTKVATMVSELARNIVMYAGSGEVSWRPVSAPRRGLELSAADEGPGIADLNTVLDGAYRSRHGMGLGLRGVRALADDTSIDTAPGKGTRVVARLFVSR